jgi:hypothetical protein
MSVKRNLFILAFVLFVPLATVKAQVGHYISFWGGPQLVSYANFNDFSAEYQDASLDRQNTLRAGGGVDYVYNFHPFYGFQTGIYYSESGQKYAGHINFDGNNPGPRLPVDFTSHVYINYLRVPLAFRFNSEMDADARVNMSMYLGMQLGFLIGKPTFGTSPAPPDSLVKNAAGFDTRKLYNSTDLGLLAGVQINVRITKRFTPFMGVRFERSFTNIEDLGTVIPHNYPVEYDFPISTKKTGFTDHDARSAYPTKNNTVSLFIGFSIKIASAKDPGIHAPAGQEIEKADPQQ